MMSKGIKARVHKVSIVGTAGRKGDGKKMTKELYRLMYEKAKDVIENTFNLQLSKCHVVSGGAAWAGNYIVTIVLINTLNLLWYLLYHYIPYAGKFWRGKILANLAINANLPNFFPANTYKDTETTEDLPLDLPKFSSFASTVAIRQNFTPPKFSRVR